MKTVETSLVLLAGSILTVAGLWQKEHEDIVKPVAGESAECVRASKGCVPTVDKQEDLKKISEAVNGGWQQAYADIVKPLAEECAECVGADTESVRAVYMHEELKTISQGCLLYCVCHKFKLMNGTKFADEKVWITAYKTAHTGQLERLKHARKNVKQCMKKGKLSSNSDPCKMAMTVQECFRNQN